MFGNLIQRVSRPRGLWTLVGSACEWDRLPWAMMRKSWAAAESANMHQRSISETKFKFKFKHLYCLLYIQCISSTSMQINTPWHQTSTAWSVEPALGTSPRRTYRNGTYRFGKYAGDQCKALGKFDWGVWYVIIFLYVQF